MPAVFVSPLKPAIFEDQPDGSCLVRFLIKGEDRPAVAEYFRKAMLTEREFREEFDREHGIDPRRQDLVQLF